VTSEVSVLCDPWFTDGAYDGAWFQYPKLAKPLEVIGKCDLVYISHIHPDHYDRVFLKRYLSVYPDARVVIADFKKNYLSKKMTADGIKHEIVSEMSFGETRISIMANELNPYDVDSALAVRRGNLAAVNMNDNLFNRVQIDRIMQFCGGNISLACLPYAGAGPYPQTYELPPDAMKARAEEKKKQFFARYAALRDALQPERVLPFAGKYFLGGRLTEMNPNRGVSDAVEVMEFCDRAFVLEDGGTEFYDLETGQISKKRERVYDSGEIEVFLKSIRNSKMDYEEKFASLAADDVPWERLIGVAYRNALKKSFVKGDYFLILQPGPGLFFALNFNSGNEPYMKRILPEEVQRYIPRSVITIDHRHLFGLLTGVWHWNNAEIGSHFKVNRTPDVFSRDVQAFLNFFHV
jgi:UDP-MurNAc hydroxylase